MSPDRVASAFLPGKIEKHRNNQRNDQNYDQGFGYDRLLQWNNPPLVDKTSSYWRNHHFIVLKLC